METGRVRLIRELWLVVTLPEERRPAPRAIQETCDAWRCADEAGTAARSFSVGPAGGPGDDAGSVCPNEMYAGDIAETAIDLAIETGG